jgi:hypothetical protein
MDWPRDTQTQAAAQNFPLPIQAQYPLPQDVGRGFKAENWTQRLRPGQDAFPPRPYGGHRACPEVIIGEFQLGHYLPALALTVSWGNMARTKPYQQHNLQHNHDTLQYCAQSIKKTNAIAGSWLLLTDDLQWTSVMASKTLHFLCRALHAQNPPVPIDGLVIRNRVWHCFRQKIPPQSRPQNWEGDKLEAYHRYMTAILTWADMKGWTTTQVEATIFEEYKWSGTLNPCLLMALRFIRCCSNLSAIEAMAVTVSPQ